MLGVTEAVKTRDEEVDDTQSIVIYIFLVFFLIYGIVTLK